MELSAKHQEYWHKNLTITAVLMAIWFVATFVEGAAVYEDTALEG